MFCVHALVLALSFTRLLAARLPLLPVRARAPAHVYLTHTLLTPLLICTCGERTHAHQHDPRAAFTLLQVPHSLVIQHCLGQLLVADREGAKVHAFDIASGVVVGEC